MFLRVALDIIPAAVVSTGKVTNRHTVLFTPEIVGLPIKEQAVDSRRTVDIVIQHIKGGAIHVVKGAAGAVALHSNKRTLRGVAASKRKQKQILSSGMDRSQRGVEFITGSTGYFSGDLGVA